MVLRLDELARQPLLDDPYPHVVFENALTEIDGFNAEFPTKDQFGPTIRMDGDLTAGDPGYEELISQSSLYGALDRQVYSTISPAFSSSYFGRPFSAPMRAASCSWTLFR